MVPIVQYPLSHMENYLSLWKMRCSVTSRIVHTLSLDGLFRVDVMQTKDKEYVVNEFESLEAAYYSGDYEEAVVHTFLENYWFEKLTSLSAEHALKNGIIN